MSTLTMHRGCPDSPVRMPDRWLASLLIEVADSYKQSTFDPLFFFITMQVGLESCWFKVSMQTLMIDRGNNFMIICVYFMIFI